MKRISLVFLVSFTCIYTEEIAPPVLEQRNFKTSGAPSCPEWQYKPFVFGSFLYWNCMESGTDFAVVANSTTLVGQVGPPTILGGLLVNASSKSISFGTNPGFRVGAGCLLPWEDTDISLAYTFLHVSGNKNVISSGSKLIFPILADPALTPSSATQAIGKWTIGFQNLDVDFEKNYGISKRVSLSPLIGLKTAWISQKRDVTYLGFVGDDTKDADITNGTYTSDDHNDFWGIGLKLGGSSAWKITSRWRFFGGLFGSLLAGNFHLKQEHEINSQTVINFKSTLHRITPTVQLNTGLDWTYRICPCSLQIKIAYDAEYWWEQGQFAYFTSTAPYFLRNQGNLGLQGLTLSTILTF